MKDSIERLQPTYSLEEDRLNALKQILPEAFADGKINFDTLRELLGDDVEDERDEHFGLSWTGKREARRLAGLPSKGTLVPVAGEGVDEATTENIFIEGDNLEVLKLLHKSYRGKIKMIYIDPPYNTGNDFIYKDDYREPLESYLERSGQMTDAGELLSSNPRSTGRFHSNWMNMMYPRLRVARDLLRNDGVIFVSIGDDEVHNLRQLMNEIFGEENFVECFIWEKKKKPAFLDKSVGGVTEYIVCFCKSNEHQFAFSVDKTTEGKKYPLNNAGNSKATLIFPPKSVVFGLPDQEINPQNMSEGNIITELLDKIVIKNGFNENEFRLYGEWRYSQTTLNEIIKSGDLLTISKIPFRPNHVKKGGEPKKMKNLLSIAHYQIPTYEDATDEITKTFGASLFDYSKPSGLIKLLLKATTQNADIILDFFAGSGTTAQAVLDLNTEDTNNRKFICVQLPEVLSNDSAARKAGFGTIAEITKERISQTIKKIKREQNNNSPLLAQTENPDKNQDLGFKVFRLECSNFRAWTDFTGQELDDFRPLLEAAETPFVAEATSDGILTEILLLQGFPLNSRVEADSRFERNKVFRVTSEFSGHTLYITLDGEIWEETIDHASELEKNDIFICLDNSLGDENKVRLADVCGLKTI